MARAPKHQRTRLKRSARIFEFIVDYPHGTRAVAGYRKAARHFGWRTRDDPSMAGSDQWRLLIGRDERELRLVAKRLRDFADEEASSDVEEDDPWPDLDILLEADVHWISQDWRYWDIESDAGAMEHLGWSRTIVPHGKRGFRVTLRLSGHGR
jgi:hypothetical protein